MEGHAEAQARDEQDDDGLPQDDEHGGDGLADEQLEAAHGGDAELLVGTGLPLLGDGHAGDVERGEHAEQSEEAWQEEPFGVERGVVEVPHGGRGGGIRAVPLGGHLACNGGDVPGGNLRAVGAAPVANHLHVGVLSAGESAREVGGDVHANHDVLRVDALAELRGAVGSDGSRDVRGGLDALHQLQGGGAAVLVENGGGAVGDIHGDHEGEEQALHDDGEDEHHDVARGAELLLQLLSDKREDVDDDAHWSRRLGVARKTRPSQNAAETASATVLNHITDGTTPAWKSEVRQRERYRAGMR